MKCRVVFEEYRQKEVEIEMTDEMNSDDLDKKVMQMYDNGEIVLTPDDIQYVHFHIKNDFER
ncbi:hypothetical protein [Weissella paramesenteroides]|uniref:hypothetical protein n=1 Tax=Weissella paramesenteroides TaxID=1249 RepID=UPI0013DD1680|nr:hypothetical protein [Weissella paramesenteroides]NEZ89048.1 hypothetical protein [Weissella paramesenteroides]NFB03373.1 hypothetical protein [Weissella paramesenteroides]